MTIPFGAKKTVPPPMSTIRVGKIGHYLVEPNKPQKGLPLLLGFHGYAQTAADTLEVLRGIAKESRGSWLCCSVQALNLFYTKSGKVVGNWMTRFDRENAISDNIEYIDAVVEELKQKYAVSDTKVLFGFSQGGPMAYRHALFGNGRAQKIIILAGDFPPELREQELSRLPEVLLCRGSEDEIMPQTQIDDDAQLFASKGVAFSMSNFEGGHESSKEFCEIAGKFISE